MIALEDVDTTSSKEATMFLDSMSEGGVYPLRALWVVLLVTVVATLATQIH